MPELLLELFSEEIPARMQVEGARTLLRLTAEALAVLTPSRVQEFSGPRRIAIAAVVNAGVAETRQSERGPRVSAPEQALSGFLRKHGAVREDLREEKGFWVLDRVLPGLDAATLIAREIPKMLWRFPWPKSMRWGAGSAFTWVRPLRRILCVLDGAVVPFDLRQGEDDGHDLTSSNLSEGHRFMAPGAFAATSVDQWRRRLRIRYVIADAAERRTLVANGITAKAAEHGLSVAPDAGLLDEVAGLVEWPVPLLGRIDETFMDLPPEVMQVSMRVNQRYFALRDSRGAAASWFAFAAGIGARDGGATIIAGNERVLRARFADARHFWDLDRQQTLESRVPALKAITFHAKLGTQFDRVCRIESLVDHLPSRLLGTSSHLPKRAALLAKADLTTGIVGEFPELQGVMGYYYARNDGEPVKVAEAIRDHYRPRGTDDDIPTAPIAIAVALADKIDLVASFFAIGEKPTGSGDPFALRRAALGIIRIVSENNPPVRLSLAPLLEAAGAGPARDEVLGFIFERLRVKLRAEGARHDVLAAVLRPGDDDIVLVLNRMEAVASLLGTEDGNNLLTAYKRTANILRIEEAKDGPIDAAYESAMLKAPEEIQLHEALNTRRGDIVVSMTKELYRPAMRSFAMLREPIDRFFDRVTVNDTDPALRRNRLGMLSAIRTVTRDVADFSKIEG
jgi:glycyl-tRNA synthetase beta chain